ncbi:MAG TPA: ATP-dependent DNA helicase RecQ [Flavisolibacter sp.]|nr:ATP-dependent DNA helicase RecQ [Flavisolibacter sp.]
MKDIRAILKKHWGYDAFRPQQEEVIQSILAGHDTLALLPTGGGKSICYQVPALAQEGICLVVSPLIALMKDQVESLKKRGIGALVIYSGMGRADIIRTLENARQEYFKFLYISPERLETSLFKEYLPALNVNLVAVDEAHCVSQWGYDFRPSYLRIAILREELPDVPVLAVTASATESVQKDICERLALLPSNLENGPGRGFSWNIFRQPFERKNISYSVFKSDGKSTKLVSILKKVQGSAIVYCKSRKRTSEVASLLQMHGLSASFYHAGLGPTERAKRQQDWIDNKTRIIVCTNAFGMGIDKPDVRIVVHTDAPDCLENYYQEAGRCGRDGQKAYAVLLYDDKDIEELEGMHLVRYPSFEIIQTVYESIVNYLQLPVYSGQDKSFNFRFDEFIRNFKLQAHQALYAMQALEGDGWLEYNEKAFTPATLVFTTSKNLLYEFYKSHPEHEATLTTLLRTYEGVFDFPAFLSEGLLVKLLRKDEEEIKNELQKISSYGIIRYAPVSDAPQIYFRKNRVAAADLKINLTAYNKRKEIFMGRVKKMVQYITLPSCRSYFISHYFGDVAAKDCGVCDNCLLRKRNRLSSDEFNSIAAAILSRLAQAKLNAIDLIGELKPIGQDKAWEVLRFLQAENKISTSTEGLLCISIKQ